MIRHMKKQYIMPRMVQQVEVRLECAFLNPSVVDNLTVESTGQEVVGVYDYGTTTTFNHEWVE